MATRYDPDGFVKKFDFNGYGGNTTKRSKMSVITDTEAETEGSKTTVDAMPETPEAMIKSAPLAETAFPSTSAHEADKLEATMVTQAKTAVEAASADVNVKPETAKPTQQAEHLEHQAIPQKLSDAPEIEPKYRGGEVSPTMNRFKAIPLHQVPEFVPARYSIAPQNPGLLHSQYAPEDYPLAIPSTQALDRLVARLGYQGIQLGDIVRLEIGGERIVQTTVATLVGKSKFFQEYFSLAVARKHGDGSLRCIVDTDYRTFEHILQYMRRDTLPLLLTNGREFDLAMYAKVHDDAKHFGLDMLARWIELKLYRVLRDVLEE